MIAKFKRDELEFASNALVWQSIHVRESIMNRMNLTENSAKLSLKSNFFLIRKKK